MRGIRHPLMIPIPDPAMTSAPLHPFDAVARRYDITNTVLSLGQDRAWRRATRAALQFEANQDPAAIAEMEAILRDAPPSDETRNMKLALAKMLAATKNTVGARAQRVQRPRDRGPRERRGTDARARRQAAAGGAGRGRGLLGGFRASRRRRSGSGRRPAPA